MLGNFAERFPSVTLMGFLDVKAKLALLGCESTAMGFLLGRGRPRSYPRTLPSGALAPILALDRIFGVPYGNFERLVYVLRFGDYCFVSCDEARDAKL